VSASHSQHAHGLKAKAGVAAGDQDDATRQVKTFGYFLGGGLSAELSDWLGVIDSHRVVTAATAWQSHSGTDGGTPYQ
jgi:hypothetical protein